MRQILLLSCFLALLLGKAELAGSQGSCPHATLLFDTTRSVDAGSICQAAEPLASRDLRVLVFLTDQRTNSEDAWFDLIDQAEVQAGFRDPNQADIYARNGITLAASTDTSTLWGINSTFGEDLFDRPADRRFDQIRSQMRPLMQSGEVTEAMVTGLGSIDAFNYPPSPLRHLLPIGGAGIAGSAGWILWGRRKRRQQLTDHIKLLQARVGTLMYACDQLLTSGDPQEMLHYQLFMALGGEQAPGLRDQLLGWLSQARASLEQAFTLHDQLNTQSQTLNQDTLAQLDSLIRNWETLYITLIGNRPEIQSLSEDEIQTLLNPMQYLPERIHTPIRQQLNDLQQQLEGRPFKVDLMKVNPAQADSDGILGLIDKIDTLLRRAETAATEAPRQLNQLKSQRQTLQQGIPQAFPFNAHALFLVVDQRLQQAETQLSQQRPLACLDACEAAQQGLDAGLTLVNAYREWQGIQNIIEAHRFNGYRLASLNDQPVEQLKATLASRITSGQLAELPALAQQWAQAINNLRRQAEGEVNLHQSNIQALGQLKADISTLSAQADSFARTYYKTAELTQAQTLLQSLQQDRIPLIENLNSLQQQDFAGAQSALNSAKTNLDQVRQLLRRVENQGNDDGNNSYNRGYRSGPGVIVINQGSSRPSSSSSWKSSSSGRSSSGGGRSSSGGSSSRSSSGGSSRRR